MPIFRSELQNYVLHSRTRQKSQASALAAVNGLRSGAAFCTRPALRPGPPPRFRPCVLFRGDGPVPRFLRYQVRRLMPSYLDSETIEVGRWMRAVTDLCHASCDTRCV